MNDRERRVRDEAHRIWIEEGRPEGSEQRHWTEAERRVAAAENLDEVAVGKPKGEKRQKPPKPGAKGAAGAITGDVGKATAKKAIGKKALGKKAVGTAAAGKQAEASAKRKPSGADTSQIEGAAALPAPGPAGAKDKLDRLKAGKAESETGEKPGKKPKMEPEMEPERRLKSGAATKSGKAKG